MYFGPNNAYNYADMLRMNEDQTSNRAELQAAIVALEIMERKIAHVEVELVRELIIKTDSEYVAKSMNLWVWNWEMNGWKTIKGGEVGNQDLMKRLHEQIKVFEQEHGIHVRFWKVGREWNKEADEMVKEVLNRR